MCLFLPAALCEEAFFSSKWHEDTGVFIIANEDGGQGLADADGNVLLRSTYAEIYGYSHGLFIAMYHKDGKPVYGYIDARGDTAIPFIYREVTPFSDGIALVMTDEGYTYINTSGRPAWENMPDYQSYGSFSHGYAPVADGETGDYFYINTSGEKAFGGKTFEIAGGFSCGLASVKTGKTQYQYINTDGEFVFDATFRKAHPFLNNIAYTYTNEKISRFIDTEGNPLLELEGKLSEYDYEIPDENTIIIGETGYIRTETGFIPQK